MSAPLGTYAFLPWLRRGISAQIGPPDSPSLGAPRVSVPVQVGFNTNTLSAGVDLGLLGPGEVTGIDERTVIRTWPRHDVFDAEANYFPLIEFDQPDLPWRYTPARATVQSRLRPWIGLVTLKADEIDSFRPVGPERALPVLRVKTAASLPKPNQSWAWAHVQVSGRQTVTPDELASLLLSSPHLMISRLLCPRRLEPKTAYMAFVVPTFERGRLAGLGRDVPDGVDALAPAWGEGQAMIELPVYYRWRFQTGEAGDFESLVRKLRARAMPPEVGIRPMDVSDPGLNLPSASTLPLGLEGALKSPATVSTVWDPAERTNFIASLRTLLNRPADLLSGPASVRVVAPPLYGRWHAARDRLNPAERPPWFQDLNSDPRHRVSAGLGTLVVQDQQQPLMASAWQQVEKIRRINETLRFAQFAREAAIRIHKRHLAVNDLESVLMVTSPIHSRVMGSPFTVQKLLSESPIAGGALEAQFRRVGRPLGPIGRRQGRAELPRTSNLFDRMNRGELSPAVPPPTPSKMTTPSRAGAGLVPGWATPEVLKWLRSLPAWLMGIAIFLFVLGLILFIAGMAWAGVLAILLAAGGLVGSILARRRSSDLDRRTALREGNMTPGLIRSAPGRPDFVATESSPGVPPPAPPPPGRTGGTDSPSAQAFRQAAAAVFGLQSTPVAEGPSLRPVKLPELKEKILTAIDPRVTIVESIRSRVRLIPDLVWKPEDPIEPIMAAPEFPQPMYEPLRDLSQDWLLPGLEHVPGDSVTLVLTNQKFVEAYMVGLNHEMGRELLWNEFPTLEQRASYFRQFWDARGTVVPAGEAFDPEKYRDIKPIHAWPKQAPLGINSSRQPPPGGEHLVLLIRGELLRRYPTAVVYAVKAARGAGGLRELTDIEKHPVFRGTLKPDVSFFSFELSKEQVKGTTDPAGDQGWFFVVQEQPSEPRFGLDVAVFPAGGLGKWSDLSWAHIAANQGDLDGLVHIDLNAQLPDTRSVAPQPGEPSVAWHGDAGLGPGGTRASDLAFITLQRPVRIAIHGSDMLP